MAEKNKNTGPSDDQMLISNKKLFADISHLIEQSRQQVAMQANSALTLVFWQVGKRIIDDICKTSGQNMENRLYLHWLLSLKNSTEGILPRKMYAE